MVALTAKLGPVIGGRSAKKIADQLGLHTVDDLLRYFPRRYVDFSRADAFADLVPGQFATFVAQVVSVKNFRYNGNKWRTQMTITDGTEELAVTFFGQPFLERTVAVGSWQLFSGEVGEFRGQPQVTHPDRRSIDDAEALLSGRAPEPPSGLTPIYPANRKLASWEIEKAVQQVLSVLDDDLADPLPAELGHPSLAKAFGWIHTPDSEQQWRWAQARFRFEEAFVIQTIFARRRLAIAAEPAVARPPIEHGLRQRFWHQLPFELTVGQAQVVAEISDDLCRAQPMHRLLQGEVGSGKTVVAVLAMLQVVDAGGQAALLAPTEVLAMQHHRSITGLLGPLAAGGMLGGDIDGTRVALLTGSMGAKARKAALLDIASGQAGIVIGTHALLEETVTFAELAMVVVDEQHRFGVEQRAVLADRSDIAPHTLVMTATPIPRTVAMTVFGDLETSTLRELPAGRQPIQTTVVAVDEQPHWLDRAWERIGEEVGRGRQAYVVASRIGDQPTADETSTVSALELCEQLQAGPLARVRVGLLHGRMQAEDKDATMTRFTAGELDVLVATTVIEVGVDVPNATVMVIMDADRFGVSQLHQLRGRVGRGSEPGLCLLVTHAEPGSAARERLDAVASTADGFALARFDVELRREGDVLGARQSGLGSSLKLLSVVRDEETIVRAREHAVALVEADPDLSGHRALAAAVRALEETEQADFLERA